MKKFVRRPAAALMAAIIAAGGCVCSGCWGKKGDSKAAMAEIVTIEDDTEWFNTSTVVLDHGYDPSELEYCDMSFVGTPADDQVMVHLSGLKKIPDDYDWETGDYTQFNIDDVVVYGTDGQKLKSISLDDVLEPNEYVDNVQYEDGEVFVTYSTYDEQTWESVKYKASLDMDTGALGAPQEITDEAGDLNEDAWYEGEYDIEGYNIKKYYMWNDDGSASYLIRVTSPSGSQSDIYTAQVASGVNIWDITAIIGMGNGEALISGYGDDGNVYLKLDLASASLSLLPSEECDWIQGADFYYGLNSDELGFTFVDQEGIKRLDFDNHEMATVIDFNCANVNRVNVSNGSLISVSEDKAVIMSNRYNEGNYFGGGYESECSLTTIERADSNPNAGKTVLKVCDIEGISNQISDAIYDFNEQSDDYFIIIDSRYDYSEDISDLYADAENADDYASIDMTARADLSDQLSIDIMNGEGPDILLGTFQCSQLNSEAYLTDLTSYLDDYGTDAFFDNVFEASKTDEYLYQIPLSFRISGIITDEDNVEDGQIGFTYDEYLDFLDDVCNGDSPVYLSKNMFFVTCLEAMDDAFFEDGNVDFSNDEFADLADFCDTYVNDTTPDVFYSVSAGSVYVDDSYGDAASYSEISSFNGYIDPYGDCAARAVALGLPSGERRGPQIRVIDSAAISASCASPDGCWEFITFLLDYDNQMDYSTYQIPVNKDAFEASAQESVDACNAAYSGGTLSFSGISVNDGERYEELDYSVIDKFEDIIASCSHAERADQAVSVIISEEMPAYFEGQKSLDEVVDILQDRVQTVLDERG